MSFSTTLEPLSALGMAGIVNTGPGYVNDASIVMPVGNQIIQQSLDTGERSFLLGSRVLAGGSRHSKLTGFAVTTDGTMLAVASTRHNDSPIVMIYTIPGGIEVLQLPQENASEVHFVTFHPGKPSCGCILVTDPRMFRLTFFDTVQKREGRSVRFPERYEIATFHPTNENLVILFSAKALAYCNSGDDSVTPVHVPNYSKFTGFVFHLNDPSMTVATSGRDLLFFKNFKLEHTMTVLENSPIVFIASFAHGFVLSTENHKIIFIQHVPGFKDIQRTFQQGTVLPYNIAHPIVWCSFSPSGHQMICNIDYRQLLIVNTREFESNAENSLVNPNIISHKGPVAAISSCAYKPMFVSCGAEDKTVIVWDYSKQQAVLHTEFTEQLTDVSFHPSGDLLAVASSEKLCLLAATVDSLVDRAQWPLFNCLSIEFSNGGHFLVAASHIITFINPYTQEIIATLRGHTGLIHSLSWSPDDKHLVSSGSDGNIVEWNAVTQQQNWSATMPKCDFESSAISDRPTVIAVSRRDVIHHLHGGRHQKHRSEDGVGFSSVLFVNAGSFVLGDILGGVVVVPFPFIIPPEYQTQYEHIPSLEFSDGQGAAKYSEIEIPFLSGRTFRSHCGAISSLCSSLDGKVLFTASADSSICVFNVLNATQSYTSSAVPILRCDIPKQQFFLVSQSRFDELQHAIEKLKRDIQKQSVNYESSTIEMMQAHRKNMQMLTEQHEEKKKNLDQQIEGLNVAIDDSSIKAALIYQNMEAAHLGEAKTLTNLYEQKLALERTKCEEISKEVEDLKCVYEERIYLLRQQYKSSLQEFSDKVDREQTQLSDNLNATKHKITQSEKVQDVSLIDLDLDFEKDRMQINLEYHNQVVGLEKLHRELVAKRDKLESDTRDQEGKINELKADLDRCKEKRSELDKEINALNHTVECRSSELKDRGDTLARQAERLEHLDKSNKDLQENKDIMNYRLEEMERELQPSLDEIGRLQSELNGNSDEIRTIKRHAKANRRTMQDKGDQINVLKRKLEERKASLLKKRRVIQMFTVDLREGVGRDDVSSKADTLKQLHDKYVAAHNVEDTLKDANETIDEHTRQRQHLQESVRLLQQQVHQQQDITTKHFTTKSAENSALLSDLNRLQKENRTLRNRLENARSDVDMLESNLKRVRQAQHEQKVRQARAVKSVLGQPQQHLMGEWVKQKSRPGHGSSFALVDGRGKYLHGAKS